MRMILARHGQTQWNAQQTFRERADIVFDETGIQQEHQLLEATCNEIRLTANAYYLPRHLMSSHHELCFPGSVTDRVVDHAQCTVIVVKKEHTKY